MDKISVEDAVKSVDNAVLGVCVGFAAGFLFGAAVMAVIDHYDNKKAKLKRIRRDSDENYIYSE